MHPQIPILAQSLLIVDDNRADIEIALRALRKCGSTANVYTCDDGDDALDFLQRRGPYANCPRQDNPSLVLLDLNMPGTDGKEVLAVIRNHSSLNNIPVIVLTTSSYDLDVETCYAAGANAYVQKPIELDAYYEAIRKMHAFWLETALLPENMCEKHC